MKDTSRTILMIMALFIVTSLWTVPGTINFQGALKDADGVPVNDTKYIIFRIYDDPDTGTLLWSEDHAAVVISAGIFSEELGVAEPFPADLFDNTALYITFYVGGEEMTPRKKLLSVPYTLQAENAENADTIEDVALAGLVQQDGSGNAAITGTMTADAFVGDGSGLTNISGAFDPIYVNTAGPDAITANSSSGALDLTNTYSAGKGLKIIEAGDGVYIDYARHDGVEIVYAGDNGIEIEEVVDDGVYVNQAGDDGFHVNSAGNDGVYVDSAGDDGVFVGSAGDDGVVVYHAGNPSTQSVSSYKNGFEVAGAEGHGLYVGRADYDGVYVNSSGDDGVVVYSAGDDGFYVYNAGNSSTHTSSASKNGFEVAGAQGYGLYVGRADNDGVYVNSAGDDGVYVGVANGDGVYVNSAGDDGVYVGTAGDDGVYVYQAGNPSTHLSSSAKNGFEVAGAQGNGLYVGRANDDGVYVKSAGYDGFYVYNAGNPTTQTVSSYKNGFEVAGAERYGLYVGRADNDGVYVNSAGDDGVYVHNAGDDGVYVYSAGDDGVCANTTLTNGYGFYTNDRTYSGGGYYPARSGTFGRNTGSGTLEAGDLVCISGGYEENVLGEDGVPVVNIEKANSRNSKAIFGVVEYKVYIREEIEEFEDGKTEIQKSFRHTDGNVMPGDHLAIIVFGPVDVKVDSRAGIKIGEKLTVSDNGDARSINDEDNWRIGILGKALEDSNGKGKIKVYVNCK